ncbi:MAG: beta-lactamase family protein [Cyclobacteriaceae bacterium]|nr:beta-lactamase family protein [Cyclobacteriaceae bacterium]
MKKLILLAWLFVAVTSHAQTADTLAKIDALFSSWNNATPGVAVAVSRNNELLYNKAFGLADLEHNVPNTTETIFECGSVSKQFTAAAVLLLAKEGKLSLSDDVRKYIPELPVYDKPITIQHLLNHTSGLKDWGVVFGLTGWPRSSRVYTQALSFDVVFRQSSLNFTPGSAYSYSNSNYVLLTLLTERVSGQSLADFTTERFFKPLGMSHTKWRDNFREVIPNRAIAYGRAEGKYIQNMPFENVYGPGGLLTTTADLLRWNQLLETHELFGSATAQLRIQKGKLNNGSEISYAAGLTNGKVNGFDEINHSGATAGYRAWLAYYPQKKLSVVLLSNVATFNPVGMGRAIAEIFLGSEPERVKQKEPVHFIALSENDVKKWPGVYFNENQREAYTITASKNQIIVNEKPVKAVHPDTLYRDGVWWIKSASTTITLRNANGSTTYKKVQPSRTNFQELKGEYTSQDVGVTYRIEVTGNEIWVNRMPGDRFQLKPVFEDAFRGDDAFFNIIRDSKNKITGFEVSLSRASRVPFKKVN